MKTKIDFLRDALAHLVDRDNITEVIATDRQGIKERQEHVRNLRMIRDGMDRQGVTRVTDIDLAVMLDELLRGREQYVSPSEQFVRRDLDSPNMVDGSIFVTDARHDGAYVTVAGNAGTPIILAFDLEDIAALKELVDQYVSPDGDDHVEEAQAT